MRIARRGFVQGLLLGTGLAGAGFANAAPAKASGDESPTLKQFAAKAGLTFGSAVSSTQLSNDAALRALAIRECSIVVPENEMKWGIVERVKGKPDYAGADAIVAFAKQNRMPVRGHTAVWYRSFPEWARQPLSGSGGRDVLLGHVRDIVGHFRGRVSEWDVVNEAIDHQSPLGNAMRPFPPYAPGDFGYIADCFTVAREADPDTKLFYNDYGVEYNARDQEVRRTTMLKLIEEVRRRGAPIDGIGIQCHLKVGNNFNARIFRNFLKELADLGLRISLTELDVDDQRLPAAIASRDAMVADHAARFLDAALDERAVTKVLTWGLVNKYSWINTGNPRRDGLPNRPLPFDDDFKPTPLWQAMAKAFASAPSRS